MPQNENKCNGASSFLKDLNRSRWRGLILIDSLRGSPPGSASSVLWMTSRGLRLFCRSGAFFLETIFFDTDFLVTEIMAVATAQFEPRKPLFSRVSRIFSGTTLNTRADRIHHQRQHRKVLTLRTFLIDCFSAGTVTRSA